MQILPYQFTRKAFTENASKRPVIVYMHPYEIDESAYPDYYHEQLRKAGIKKKLKSYLNWMNRGSFYKKIDKLTTEFEFSPLVDIVNEYRLQKKGDL